jgi:type IV pilus assembly protein PilB
VLLGELLVESNVITKEQLGEVLGSPREGKKLGQILLEKGWVTEQQLTQTLSLQLSVPWVSLYHIDFSRQLLNRVSRELAEMYCLIPIFVRHVRGQGETLYVAMDDPTNENALQEVSRLANLPTKPMIASASDIRSAIRVYYGESGATNIDVPVPPRADVSPKTVAEPAVTVREPRPVAPPTPKPKPEKPKTLPNMTPAGDRPSGEAAPITPAAATIPDLRPQSAPPPAPSVIFRKTQPSAEEPPVTTRSEPPGAPREREVELPLPRRHIARPADDSDVAKRRPPKMVALTLLDGTTLTLPAKKPQEAASEALTARDIASALRAAAHGADASEILGDQVRWEPIVAALLSILLRKGLIADWEFVEELRKF